MKDYFTKYAAMQQDLKWIQTVEPVVDVIVECLQSVSPRMRYPTSDYVRQVMERKYSDSDKLGTSLAEEHYEIMKSNASEST